jgi:hypothetical protein
MRVKDIVLGEYYRYKGNNYAWAKPVRILKPHEDVNVNDFIVVKCEWTTSKNATFGFIKYFKPSELVLEANHDR